MQLRRLTLILLLMFAWATPNLARDTAEQKEAKRLEKEAKVAQKEQQKRTKRLAKQNLTKQKSENSAQTGNNVDRSSNESSASPLEGYNESNTIRLEENFQADQKNETRPKSQTELEKARQELKENEQKALEFIFPSIDDSSDLSREEFFSQTEKEQLLELWRATLARNRTIQFIIKALSTNPNSVEKNNAVLQGLSQALFVPFYAVSAIANNSLISGGSMVGARVIGDVVENVGDKRNQTQQVTKTDLIVLFMLVDEVAQRLRESYYSYKDAKIQKELLRYEMAPARIDAAEALNKNEGSSVFFTRMVLRDLERRLRQVNLTYLSNRRTLVELAGEEPVKSVDLLIDLEVEEIMSDVAQI